MKNSLSVLLVDDQVGDIGWLIDLIQSRGYLVVLAANEKAARQQFDLVKQGKAAYALAIVDVMVAIMDLMDLIALDGQFFESSQDTGIRLCRYARQDLGLSAEELPIICVTVREDPEVKAAMKELDIPHFNRTSYDSIRQFIEALPAAAT